VSVSGQQKWSCYSHFAARILSVIVTWPSAGEWWISTDCNLWHRLYLSNTESTILLMVR